MERWTWAPTVHVSLRSPTRRKTSQRESGAEPMLQQRPKCYIASPLGFSEAGRYYYREVYLPALAKVVAPLDPWSLVAAKEIDAARAAGQGREMMQTIGRRNIGAIRECSLLAAYLDGQELDSGTTAEVGFAAGVGLMCFGLRTDLRECGETSATINLQVEAFILESGGRICSSLDELAAELGRVGVGHGGSGKSAPRGSGK
jgi:nucleoside 2-deoxyribosyltransferase